MDLFMYDQLSDKQREQVAVQYSGDALLGNDPTHFIYEANRNGFVLSRRRMTPVERERLERQRLAQDVIAEVVGAEEAFICYHCDQAIPKSEVNNHWRTCPNSPSRAEIERLREAIKDARRLLATSRTVGGSPDCILAAENTLIEALGA